MSDLHEYPAWIEGMRPATYEDAPLPARADVAIVGGGITGLAAARELARRGVSVALLEERTPGWGASSRNGGMVLTGLKLGAADLIRRYGHERARRMFAASLAAIDCVERLVAEERIDCNFARDGHLLLASKPSHTRALAEEIDLLDRAFGHPSRLIGRHEIRDEVGSDAYYGAVADERSAGINPARYVDGLAGAAARAGACLLSHAPVSAIRRAGAGFRLVTARGELRAGAVLIASGGYTGPATPRLQRKIVPLGSYIIATAPLPEPLARDLSPRGRMMFDSLHLLHYFRLTPDRRMLFGGRAAFFPATAATVRRSVPILQRDLLAVFPQLRGVPITHAWGGTLDVPFDMMPHAGELDGMYYALGYAGHGVALASYLGTLMARRIAGERPDNPFEEIPFPGAPLGVYTGRPWFLPFAGAWYRLLDALH